MTLQEFDDAVSRGCVMVDFYAKWCSPCKMLSPILDELDAEENFVLIKLDVDENSDIAVKQQINQLPTILVFQNGREVARLFGLQTKEQLRQSLRIGG